MTTATDNGFACFATILERIATDNGLDPDAASAVARETLNQSGEIDVTKDGATEVLAILDDLIRRVPA